MECSTLLLVSGRAEAGVTGKQGAEGGRLSGAVLLYSDILLLIYFHP